MRASTAVLLLALQQQQAASFVCIPGAPRPSSCVATQEHVRHDAGTGAGTGRGGFRVVGGGAITAMPAPRSSATRVRSQDTPATNEDDDAVAAEGGEEGGPVAAKGGLDSLKASDLLGGAGSGSGMGVAAAAAGAVADLGEPGKLVREAVKPFQEEMDRIEADFEKSVKDNTEDMERRLAEMMKRMDED